MPHHSAALRSRFMAPSLASTQAQRALQALISALLLMLLGAAWIVLAPSQFGGQAAYVIVNGISMEPGFHRGDLAILRQAPEYQIGDVVTYRHPQIGPIIHRIIALDGDRYVLKGDNNAWVDSYHPSRAECIGKLWLHLPAAGGFIEQLRIPRNMAMLAAVLGCMVMATITSGAGRPQLRPAGKKSLFTIRLVVGGRSARRASKHHARPTPAQPHAGGAALVGSDILLFGLAALACASLLLAIYAFLRPTTRSLADDIAYEQTGTFSYSATAPLGVYDSDSVQTGEPVFRQLTDAVDVQFVYRLAAEQQFDVHGSSRLAAEVSDTSGWKRVIELQPSTEFSGASFTARGSIDLARVQALIDNFERQTGIQRQQYALALVASTAVEGTLSGQELRDEYAPRLEFLLDRQQLQLAQSSSDRDKPFVQSQQGLLKRSREQPNTLTLLGLTLEVADARRVALAGLCLALGGALLLGYLMSRAGQGDEPTRIQHKYGPLLIAIRDSQPGDSAVTIDVTTIDDLARLAEQHGLMIMHAQGSAEHSYFVYDGKLSYRYRITTTDDGAV
ncbi:MAG TPA: signal peptidase I [Roseiflexaceae bacterium]|nr:signal peptidase I [Roseiflexaceae bacterium]